MYIEKPTSPYAQRATWTEYQEHNIIKALVGITPSGYFSFLSNSPTEQIFKFIIFYLERLYHSATVTQASGLVELLDEGDSAMAGLSKFRILTRAISYPT